MKKRALSIVLCLILAFGLLPMGAMAAEISSVKITVTRPYTGETPDFAPQVPSGTYLVSDYPAEGYVGGVRWTDSTEGVHLGPEDKFVEGHTYTLRIALGAISPNTFQVAGGVDVNVKVTLNASQIDDAHNLTAAGYSDPSAYLSVMASFVAGARPKENTYLSAAYVKLQTPVAGELPDTNPRPMEKDFAMAAAGYTVSKVEWLEKNNNGEFVNMKSDARFTEGEEYAVRVTVKVKDGYRFAAQVKDCWFNTADDSGKATPYSSGTYECVFYKTYTAAPSPKIVIKQGSVTITPPVAGKLPDYVPEFSEGLFYGGGIHTDTVREGVEWSGPKGVLRWDEPFELGEEYTVTIQLQVKNGYILWREGYQQTFIEVNGGQLGASTQVNDNRSSATVTCTFPPAEEDPNKDTRTVIPEAAFSLAMPTAGAHPDFDLKILRGECVLITESDNEEIQAEWKEMEAMGFRNGVGWFDEEAETVLTENDVFEEGKTYMMELFVLAGEGWRFDEEGTAVTLNGAAPESLEEEGSSQYSILIVGGEFVCGPAKKPVSLAVTTPPAKTAYQPGEAFDPAGMTVTVTYEDQSAAEVTDYAVTPQTLSESDAAVTISYTENGVTVTTELAVTVEPEKKNPFEDVAESDYFCDAVLWAYYAEPQVTNGIDATHFGPTSTVTRGQAVTFLWRAMGCPEPESADNPFEDVKESNYFYKPVLWAVEQGITNGTDASHFTPAQTCSTAHILTFLYRALGIGSNGWYEVAEAWAKGAKLLEGLDVTVAPGVDCPRCDVVLFLYRQLA